MEVLPLETSGKGNPVGGILPVTTSALTIVCIPKIIVIPTDKMKPKTFFDFDAIFNPRYIIKNKSAKNKISPINPISSPIIERIKSDSAKGKNAYF